ncbi:MAG: LytTR family transcriptional regulator DNA-binding domain-containing protein [Oscillospiraceae bacterium]|nr:LytTR family transcriptional regulator DNA-binding domain-containing protein [Oscillospiraceae bacterium]
MYIAICDDHREEVEPRLLLRQEFVRCHRSYIVNLLQVAELSAATIRTFLGKTFPVSRALYKEVQEQYMTVLFAGGEA